MSDADTTVERPGVLIRQGWPYGVCPIHLFEALVPCNAYCLPARIAIAVIQEGYDEYWRTTAINQRWEREVAAA